MCMEFAFLVAEYEFEVQIVKSPNLKVKILFQFILITKVVGS